MKILMVGGTWDNEEGKSSSIVKKISNIISTINDIEIIVKNGGNYNELEKIANSSYNYDIVFWWANVSNDLSKIRNIKEIAPHIMLVSSKRNDNNKYSFQELVNRALSMKANLVFEFKKQDDGLFHIMVFDSLGSSWYEGTDLEQATISAISRLKFLSSATRQKTIKIENNKNLILNWFFDQFKQEEYHSDNIVEIPNENEFVDLVRFYAERFHEIMNPVKKIKNINSIQLPPQVGRCSKGMPSFKVGNYIFASQRNVNEEYLTLEHFVPTYLKDDKVFYCGDNKPSVDTPIQLRLYEKLPNINYIIHSHCYIENASFTSYSIPCGAIEEVNEVLKTIENFYGNFYENCYKINLLGHGSFVFGNTIEDLKNLSYIGRPFPEKMF